MSSLITELKTEERVEKFRQFYNKTNQKPLLGFYTGSEYPLGRYASSRSLPENRELTPADFDVDSYMDDCEKLFRETERCGGDFIWTGSAFWGIPWLEAVSGCPIYANHSSGSLYAVSPGKEISSLTIDEGWLKKLVEFMTALSKSSSGRWPVGVTRLRGISDLLSALYGGVDFIYAMLEKPDEVLETCRKITEWWIRVARLQLEHMPLYHGGVGTYSYNLWAPADTVFIQEDSAALLSPQMYEKFIKPFDEEIIKAFKGCIVHLHSTGYVPVKAFMDMGVTAVEMHRDQAGPSLEMLYDTYVDILEHKPLLLWGTFAESEIDWIFEKLPHAGLAVGTFVETPSDAERLWRKHTTK